MSRKELFSGFFYKSKSVQVSGIFRWGLYVMAFFLFSCSSLHVDVGQTFDWGKVSIVSLQEPPQDPWLLTPAIRLELEDMGFTVIREGDGNPDLMARFFFKDGPDLDSNGNLFTRLKSLHVQFVDPATGKNVAVADYFYADDNLSEPLEGVKLAFAALRRDIRAEEDAQIQPAPATIPQPLADSAASLPSVTKKQGADVTEPPSQVLQPLAGSTATAPSPPQKEDPAKVEDQAPLPMPGSQSESMNIPGNDTDKSKPLSGQGSQPITPVTEKSQVREVKPKTVSPWVPRFKSWGFENWGEQDEDGY